MKLQFIKKKKKVGLTYRWWFLNEQSDLKKEREVLLKVDSKKRVLCMK